MDFKVSLQLHDFSGIATQVNILAEDITSLSRHNKGNLDVLGGLEARVKALRATNMHGASMKPWADRKVLTSPPSYTFASCLRHDITWLVAVLPRNS